MRTRTTVRGGAKESERAAVVMSLLASLLYGSQYVAIKEGIRGFTPLLFGTLAMAIGGVLAVAFTLRRRAFPFHIFRRWEVWVGVLLATSMITFQYLGLTLSTASIGGLIIGSNIIFVAPISALLLKERLGLRRAAGVGLGLFGLVTITTQWDLSVLTSTELTGDLLLLGASLSIALTYPLTMSALKHMEYYEWVMSFHLLSPIPLLLLTSLTGPVTAEVTALPFLLYVGLFCTALPTMLWARGLKSITMTTSATILMSESAFAVLLGWLVLHDPIDLTVLVGAGLIFLAIYITAGGTLMRRAEQAKPQPTIVQNKSEKR